LLKRSGFIASAAAAAVTAVRGEAAILTPHADPYFSARGVSAGKVDYQAFINQNVNQFGTSFASLAKAGWILISLDVYGAVGNELYASVWVKRTLPYGWLCEVELDFTSLGNLPSQYPGYVPVILAATGDASNPSISVVMHQTYNYFYWWFALSGGSARTQGTFQYWDAQYRAQNLDLAALAVYGDPGAPQYLACWSGNGTALKWADSPYDGKTELATLIADEKKAGYRPTLVARNAYGVYSSIYHADNVGPWLEQHEMSTAGYQRLYATMTAKGYMPISVRAGGSSAAPVFAAIFAETDQPIPPPRKLTITGNAVSTFATIESEIVKFMETNAVRAGQLTIAKRGVVQYERAFTYAEVGYPLTQTTSLFRLASVSKAFVEAAVQTLFDQKKLAPTTLVFPKLGFKNPGDPRSNQITVQQLLDHTGGYDDTEVADPVFSMRQIALDLNLKVPIDVLQFVQWVYSQKLQHNPGTVYAYSNTGYAILSYLISVVSGMPFIEFIDKEVMAPLGVKAGVDLTRTAQNLRLAGEVFYDDDEVGYSALAPTSLVLIPAAYGGDQLLYEVAQGASSIACSATAVTTLIHTWLVWGNGKRPAPGNWYWQRDGSMPGTTSVAGSRGNDGVDFCFIFNTRNWAPGASASPPDDLANTINALLDRLGTADERFAGERRTQQVLPYRGEALLRRRRAAELLRNGR
jgi:CubicO group peptidase (beta-lactamase class C family)